MRNDDIKAYMEKYIFTAEISTDPNKLSPFVIMTRYWYEIDLYDTSNKVATIGLLDDMEMSIKRCEYMMQCYDQYLNDNDKVYWNSAIGTTKNLIEKHKNKYIGIHNQY